MLRTQHGVRLLGPSDLPALSELVARDPVVNVFVDHRLPDHPTRGGWAARWQGYVEDGELVSACHAAANLAVPVKRDPEAVRRSPARSASAGAAP